MQPVALLRGGEREADAGVAGGRLDDRPARLEQPVALGRLDHREADPVLDRAAGVEVLELGEDAARGRPARAGRAGRSACSRPGRGSSDTRAASAAEPTREGRTTSEPRRQPGYSRDGLDCVEVPRPAEQLMLRPSGVRRRTLVACPRAAPSRHTPFRHDARSRTSRPARDVVARSSPVEPDLPPAVRGLRKLLREGIRRCRSTGMSTRSLRQDYSETSRSRNVTAWHGPGQRRRAAVDPARRRPAL